MHLYSNFTVHLFLSLCFFLFFCLYLSLSLSLFFTQLYSIFFGCTNLQRAAGRHGGSQRCQVDVSALLPSLCLPKSLHNKTRSELATHTHTLAHLSVAPAAVKMLMQGWQWSLWKEMTLDARHQAPGKARDDSGGTNKRLIHPIMVSSAPSLSLCTLSACLSVSFPLYSPPVPNLGYKNAGIPNEPSYWKPGKYCPSVTILKVSLVPIYESIWMTNHCRLVHTKLCLFVLVCSTKTFCCISVKLTEARRLLVKSTEAPLFRSL